MAVSYTHLKKGFGISDDGQVPFCISMNSKEAASGRTVSVTATFTGSGSGSSAQTDVLAL